MSAICPINWRDDDTCPVIDTGEHCCVLPVGSPNHACPCGATRALEHESIGRASVSVNEKGRSRVMVGLTDISSSVSGGTVEFTAGHPTVITVDMPAVVAVARGEIELDEKTEKALEALGWVGPDEMLLRRRDLQEALGGLGTVLREWDDLLAIARQMSVVLIEAPKTHPVEGDDLSRADWKGV